MLRHRVNATISVHRTLQQGANTQPALDPNPIGIFDSGSGGLSVLKEIVLHCPDESAIYVADVAYCPYGGKSAAQVVERAQRITHYLLEQGCKLIVVACNTATSAAIGTLRAQHSAPFVGMEPAVKPASERSLTRSIGVLATAGTLKGQRYAETTQRYAADVEICIQAGDGLVELVEANRAQSPEAEALLAEYIEPMLAHRIDQLVLGCTHYPFLMDTIKKVLPEGVEIVNPAPSVARQCRRVLMERGLQAPVGATPHYRFHSSGSSDTLQALALSHVLSSHARASFHAHTPI